MNPFLKFPVLSMESNPPLIPYKTMAAGHLGHALFYQGKNTFTFTWDGYPSSTA